MSKIPLRERTKRIAKVCKLFIAKQEEITKRKKSGVRRTEKQVNELDDYLLWLCDGQDLNYEGMRQLLCISDKN